MIHTRQNPRMPFAMQCEEDCFNMMNFMAFPPNSMAMYQQMPAQSSQSYMFSYHPGMKDVPGWLKTLRLHKYTGIFLEMTYEQMMGLNDKLLEQFKVTKGARGKILQSIEKLHKRPEQIRQQLDNLVKACNPGCRCAIILLRQVLTTPIRSYLGTPQDTQEILDGFCPVEMVSNENIPGLLIHLLTKVHNVVFQNRLGDIADDYMSMLFKVYDLILSSDAFTENQKRRVMQMKKKARTYNYPADLRRNRPIVPHSGKCDFCQQLETTQANGLAAYQQQMRQIEMQDFFNFSQFMTPPPRQQPQAPQAPPQREPFRAAPGPPAKPQNSNNNRVNCNNYLFAMEPQPFGGQPSRESGMTWFNAPPAAESRFMDKQGVDPRISRIPQYRSSGSLLQQPAVASVAPKKEKVEIPPLFPPRDAWPSKSLYESDDLIGASSSLPLFQDMAVPSVDPTAPAPSATASLWSPTSGRSTGDSYSSSGYSSSTSERGSGAGSPRARVSDSQYNLWSDNYDNLLIDFTSALKL